MEKHIVSGYIKECCKDRENLLPVEEYCGQDGKDRVVWRCQVCHCRHFKFKVDPLKLNMKAEGLGSGV